jgi:hypothetical protein
MEGFWAGDKFLRRAVSETGRSFLSYNFFHKDFPDFSAILFFTKFINPSIVLKFKSCLKLNCGAAKPVVRRGRKTMGLKDEAGLPGRGSSAFYLTFFKGGKFLKFGPQGWRPCDPEGGVAMTRSFASRTLLILFPLLAAFKHLRQKIPRSVANPWENG